MGFIERWPQVLGIPRDCSNISSGKMYSAMEWNLKAVSPCYCPKVTETFCIKRHAALMDVADFLMSLWERLAKVE